MCSKYLKELTPKGMKGSVFASNIWGFDPKLTGFVKNSPQNRCFYQIKYRMHSCDTTILLENVYFTISNNLTKYLCVASVSSVSTSSMIVRKLAKIGKKQSFWVRHPYFGCQNKPFQYFWARFFNIYKTNMCVNTRKYHW